MVGLNCGLFLMFDIPNVVGTVMFHLLEISFRYHEATIYSHDWEGERK